jgi:hypothetical protein
MLAGAIGGVAKVGGGLLGKIPGLAKGLPGIAGKLGKAAGGLESLTAAPVRVVNFGEAGLGGLGGLGGTTGGLGGGGGAGAGGAAAGGLRARLAAQMGQMGRFGALMNSSFGTLGKAGMGLAGRLGIFGGAIAAAGTAGYAFGSWLNEKLGISDKLADSMHNLFRRNEILASEARVRAHEHGVTTGAAQDMANTFAKLSQSGVKQLTVEGGKKEALTRETASARIAGFLKRQGRTEPEIAQLLKGMEGTLRGIPVKVEVKVDGKTIATATSKHGQEQDARRGVKQEPGANKRAATGGR